MCKKADFTHGKWIPYAKPRVLLTVLNKLAFSCVKTLLLHTANESRVWNPVFYTRHWKKWSCDSFHLLRAIPPSVAIGHRSASGAIFDAQWNDKIPLSSWKNEVPVCEMTCFTHGKWIPCAKRPLLHTASKSRMQNPVFYTRHWQKWSPRVWKDHFYSRQTGSVCKKADFTHGKI